MPYFSVYGVSYCFLLGLEKKKSFGPLDLGSESSVFPSLNGENFEVGMFDVFVCGKMKLRGRE